MSKTMKEIQSIVFRMKSTATLKAIRGSALAIAKSDQAVAYQKHRLMLREKVQEATSGMVQQKM